MSLPREAQGGGGATPRPRARVKAKPRPAPARPVTTTPRRARIAKAQEQQYASQGRSVKHVARQQQRAAAKRQAVAREKFAPKNPIKAAQRASNDAVKALSELYYSNPSSYEKKIKEAHEKKILGVPVEHNIRKAAGGTDKLIHKAAQIAKDRMTEANRQTGYAGITPDTGAAGKEIMDIVSNMPSGAYLTGAAGFEAAKGRPQRAKKLWHDYKKTSAIAAAASGDFKEAARRASKHPISTGLELWGAKGLTGRTLGAAARHAPSKRVRAIGSTERANLQLTPDRKPGEGPEEARTYSKDIFNKAGQKFVERRTRKGSRVRRIGPNKGTQRRPGRNPNVDYGTSLVPSLPRNVGGARQVGAPLTQPVRRRLIRRADTRYYQQAHALRAHAERATREVNRALRGRKAAGVQLVAEGTVRATGDLKLMRRDLRNRRLSLAVERQKLTDPVRIKLNRKEAKDIRELEALPDHKLARVAEGAKQFTEKQAKVQARGGRLGLWDAEAQAKRFMPYVQSHVKRPVGQERRVPLTAEERQVAAKVLQRRARRGQPIPAGADLAARKAARGRREEQMRQTAAAPVQEAVAKVLSGQAPGMHVVGPAHKRGPNPTTLDVVAKRLGFHNPIRMVPLSPRAIQAGRRGGYAGLKRDPHSGRSAHTIYFNPAHGTGAKNAALWHEIQHALEVDKGRAHSPTTKLGRAEYEALPAEARARAFAEKHMDTDLFSEPTARMLAERRPKVGKPKGIMREDFGSYLRNFQRGRVRVPARRLTQAEMISRPGEAGVLRVLERRARRGQPMPKDLPEGFPAFVTQRPGRAMGPRGSMPVPENMAHERGGTAFREGSREVGREAMRRQAVMAERSTTALENFQLLDREFGRPAGLDGQRYADSYGEALKTANLIEEQHGIRYRPVNIAGFREFGATLRAKQAQGFPGNRLDAREVADAHQAAWNAATSESGRGRWVLMPEEVVNRMMEHAAVKNTGVLNSATSLFKDVVLTSSSPFRWIGGNVTDIGMRTMFAGIGPADIMRGRLITRRAAQKGLQGEQAAAAVSGGGLYHAGLDIGGQLEGARLTRMYEALSRSVAPHAPGEHLARTVLSAPWRAWKSGVYAIERSIEELPQWGAVGKEFRGSRYKDADLRMKNDLRGLLRLHDEQIDHMATKLATDRALEARLQKATEDVIGRWGKVSPDMRRMLSVAPFAQWLGAATRYVFVTLPVHHPVKTGIMAGISEMTEDERKRLGLSYFLPRDKQVQDYQMGTLPLHVGKNKYGTVVKGIRTARMTSFGTAGDVPGNLKEFLLPQYAGALDAWNGTSFTNEQLVYPDWWPEVSLRRTPIPKDERTKIGLGALIESTVPFASAFRRAILDKGRPAEPYSTILTPATRKKFDKETKQFVENKGTMLGGILEWLMPFAPEGKLYTYGAGKAIQEAGITGETLDKWRQLPRAKKAPEDWWDKDLRPKPKTVPRPPAPAADWWNAKHKPAPTPAPQATPTPTPSSQSDWWK